MPTVKNPIDAAFLVGMASLCGGLSSLHLAYGFIAFGLIVVSLCVYSRARG